MSENDALTIPGMLDRAARDFPHVEAVVDGPVRLTYSELRDQVRTVTKAFVALGVDRGERIAVWAPMTGDRSRLDDRGNLIITGRSKDMFVVGGFNVYPAEIEQVLAHHDGASEVAVIGVPDERLGEVGRAYVTARPGASLTAEALIAYCRGRLASFKVPREIVIVGTSRETRRARCRKRSFRAPDPQLVGNGRARRL